MLERTGAGRAAVAVSEPSVGPRRALFAALVVGTMTGLVLLALVALSPGGISAVDIALIGLFALTLPWQVIGLWNAVIGLLLLRLSADAVVAVTPAAGRVRGDEPITAATAILMCVRNEDPERAIRNLRPLLHGLAASGFAGRFHVYILSDTNDAALVAREESRFDALWAEWHGRVALTYRRRANNRGFKAGNIEDFCDRWGHAHDFAVTLDADSIMTEEAVLRLVRIMQADPRIGILQGLVIGAPSKSAFARLFQFGMRLGMRSYTLGSAWWQGDCGPYWGHNAILRLAPFMAHCRLPALPKTGPLGGFILSHDQVEAVLMRRAGYECRVLPREDLGFEENPPTLIEFLRRDLRWCQGNLQYLRLLGLPGLPFVSRYQLMFAILMFVGSPGWIGVLVVGTLALALAPTPAAFIRADAALALFFCIMLMWFAPKLAAAVDVLLRPAARASFGGGLRFLVGLTAEFLFTLVLLPIMWLRHTLFMAGLPFGRAIGWIGQQRDDHYVPLAQAIRHLWPHAAVGGGVIALLAATCPPAIPWALIPAGGLCLAIPFATVTSSPRIGAALAKIGIGRLPEEVDPPPVLRSLVPGRPPF